MSSWILLASLAAVDLLSILSPGPNILLVTRSAIERGRRRALLTGCGLVAGNLVWAGVALLGLTALFEVLPSLQTALRLAGAAFLLYLGVRLWRAAATADRPEAPVQAREDAHRALLQGLATGLLNPKALTYFGTIFVLFVPADASPEMRLSALAVVAVDGLLVYGLAALLFSRASVRHGYLALRRPIDRACGAVMVAFGGKLALL